MKLNMKLNMKYAELSKPFKTFIEGKRNPDYHPVYHSIKEVIEARERMLRKPRSSENDF